MLLDFWAYELSHLLFLTRGSYFPFSISRTKEGDDFFALEIVFG